MNSQQIVQWLPLVFTLLVGGIAYGEQSNKVQTMEETIRELKGVVVDQAVVQEKLKTIKLTQEQQQQTLMQILIGINQLKEHQ